MLFAETAPAYSAMSYAAALGRSFTQLQLGASGSNVLALQMRLRELGFPSRTSPASTTRRPPRP